MRSRHRKRAAALFGVSALGGAAFAAMAAASATRKTVRTDNRLHARMRRAAKASVRETARDVARPLDKAGKWWAYSPAALLGATAVLVAPTSVRRPGRNPRVGAAVILLAPVLAKAIGEGLDRWLPQPRVGRRRRRTGHPVFPSGHALGVAAVAFTTGYIVVREKLVRPRIVAPAAALAPIVVGLGRIVREKHLASDTLGGWLAGTSIAAALAGAYEVIEA